MFAADEGRLYVPILGGYVENPRPTPSSPCSPSPGEPKTYWAVPYFVHAHSGYGGSWSSMFSIMGCAGRPRHRPRLRFEPLRCRITTCSIRSGCIGTSTSRRGKRFG